MSTPLNVFSEIYGRPHLPDEDEHFQMFLAGWSEGRDSLTAENTKLRQQVSILRAGLVAVDESFNGRHRFPAEHMLEVFTMVQKAIAEADKLENL